MSAILEAKEVVKDYSLSAPAGLRSVFFRHLRQGGERTIRTLNGVSFRVERGEAFGVIGANGAGKSTLLKLISEVTLPTEGVIEIYGSRLSILELGTGFHHELTGVENVYLKGAMHGIGRREIREKLPEIIAFSGLEDFVYQPVKAYSTGMSVRLAFSIAVNLTFDLLVFDEVFAVGDRQFQEKSFRRLEKLKREGTSMVIVSHNLDFVASFCDRAMILEAGRVAFIGPPAQAVKSYKAGVKS